MKSISKIADGAKIAATSADRFTFAVSSVNELKERFSQTNLASEDVAKIFGESPTKEIRKSMDDARELSKKIFAA